MLILRVLLSKYIRLPISIYLSIAHGRVREGRGRRLGGGKEGFTGLTIWVMV